MNIKSKTENIDNSSENAVLYHYCSIESFMNIIKSKSIWLTNSAFMNDRLENKMIEKHFEDIIEILKPFKAEIYLKNLIENFKKNKNQVYLFCLSKNQDKLSQWRGYADDGKGVAIGFSFNLGASLRKKIPYTGCDKESFIGFYDIVYDIDKQKEIIQRKCDDEVRNKNDISVLLSLDFVDLSMIFKDNSFYEEEEVRLMFVWNDKCEYKPENLSDLKFRYSKEKIIDYYEFNFDKNELPKIFDSILIPKIYLGPKCEITIEEMKIFLSHNNLPDTEVIRSDSSYF